MRPRASATAEYRVKAQDTLPGGPALPRDGFKNLQLGVVACRADVLDVLRPRCDECTICIAVAPDAVFVVRTYGTGPL